MTPITDACMQALYPAPMNGYEKRSPEYGGGDPGWGTWLVIAAIVTAIAALLLGTAPNP